MCDIHVHVIKRLHCMEYVYTISSIQKKKCSDILRNVRIYIDTYYDERNMKNRPITQRVRVSYKIQFNFFPSFFFSLFIHTFKACSSGVENLFNQYLSLFFFLVTNRHLRYYQTLFKHSKGAIVSRTYKFIRSIH